MLELARVARRPRVWAAYLAGPEDAFKKRFRSRDLDAVIKAFGVFEPGELVSFLSALGGSGQGSVP
jgi:hypothetical protein